MSRRPEVIDRELFDATAAGVRDVVENCSAELLQVSATMHAHPELGFQEQNASALLCDALAAHGFRLTRGAAALSTAFRAERVIGSGAGPIVAVFCEYDALPGLGHGCGHNIIAAAGLGGAVGAADWLSSSDAPSAAGRIIVFGSPAEEGGGGKVFLLEHGELDDVDAAVMVHPAGYDAIGRTNLGRLSLEARFTGVAAHASAAPEEGRNALDAATLLLVAIGLLRQQIRPDSRIHANVVEGGDAINVIPAASTVKIFIRSEDADYLRGRLHQAVRDCVAGAALATGTTGTLEEVAKPYEPVLRNPVIAAVTQQAYAAVGRPLSDADSLGGAGSTDMGNVSQRIPAIHPYLRVRTGIPLHSSAFAEAAGSPDGQRAVLDGARILGTVVATLLARPELVCAARTAFDRQRGLS